VYRARRAQRHGFGVLEQDEAGERDDRALRQADRAREDEGGDRAERARRRRRARPRETGALPHPLAAIASALPAQS
jgi:hypothetical protein